MSIAAFAYATAALSPSMDVANAMFLTIPGMMLFACGYLIRYHDIKIWLKWWTSIPNPLPRIIYIHTNGVVAVE